MEAATLCDGRWRRPRPRRRRGCCTPRRSASPSRPPCSRRLRDPRERRHPPHRPSWRPHRAVRHAAPPSRAQAQYLRSLFKETTCVRAKRLGRGHGMLLGVGTLTIWAPSACVVACRDRTTRTVAHTRRFRGVWLHSVHRVAPRGCPPFGAARARASSWSRYRAPTRSCSTSYSGRSARAATARSTGRWSAPQTRRWLLSRCKGCLPPVTAAPGFC